jgi:hypothetical protein
LCAVKSIDEEESDSPSWDSTPIDDVGPRKGHGSIRAAALMRSKHGLPGFLEIEQIPDIFNLWTNPKETLHVQP